MNKRVLSAWVDDCDIPDPSVRNAQDGIGSSTAPVERQPQRLRRPKRQLSIRSIIDGSQAGRSKAIILTGTEYFTLAIDLGRVNSFSPSSPWIRPKPDSPTPPKGSAGKPANDSTELTLAIPLRNRRAASYPCFLPKTAAPRPYDDRLALSTASSSELTRLTARTGPNVSSRIIRASSGTSTRTIGSIHGARMLPAPPTTARAPSDSASSTCACTTSICFGIVIGPSAAPSPARTSLNSAVTSSTNWS